jgi:hypothetical protein
MRRGHNPRAGRKVRGHRARPVRIAHCAVEYVVAVHRQTIGRDVNQGALPALSSPSRGGPAEENPWVRGPAEPGFQTARASEAPGQAGQRRIGKVN